MYSVNQLERIAHDSVALEVIQLMYEYRKYIYGDASLTEQYEVLPISFYYNPEGGLTITVGAFSYAFSFGIKAHKEAQEVCFNWAGITVFDHSPKLIYLDIEDEPLVTGNWEKPDQVHLLTKHERRQQLFRKMVDTSIKCRDQED